MHQNNYKSDDELDFVPVVSTCNEEETTKDEIVEFVFLSSSDADKTTDHL